mmetsp:Transcript_8241/g.15658  ORF Transcript_8241/g.15658 Transcript_8241/m.15658 type:complete len:572 (-) Transcript_8241:563-2278(-)
MPVEDKHAVPALVHDELVLVALAGDVLVRGGHALVLLLHPVHGALEVVQELVAQMVHIHKVEPSAGKVVAIAVSRDQLSLGVDAIVAGEVDPLGVAELVAHEGEVALPAQGHGEDADHLVQRKPAVHAVRRLPDGGHLIVHVGVHQPEGQRLGPHQRLVVGLGVGDALFVVPPVLHGEHEVAHVPVMVVDPLLHGLHPLVGDGHLQPVVKPDASLRNWAAQRGHARDVLRHRDDVGIQRVQHVVGQHHVRHAVHVRVHAKVLAVAAREDVLQAVVRVHHGGDAVEPEAVKLVLLHPPAQVGEQEADGFVLAVVEEPRVPHPVVPALAGVEEVRVRAVEHVDAVQDVVGGVAVHDVHQHHQSVPMGLVDQVLELVRRAAAGGHSEKVGDVVAEGSVEGVLLDGHELDGVVAHLRCARHHVARKLEVRGHLGLRAGHAHVRLVDAQRLGLLGARVDGLVHLLLGRVVVDAVVGNLTGRLHRHLDPRRDAVNLLAPLGAHVDLDARAVRDGRRAILQVGQVDLEDAKLVLGHAVGAHVPVVEVPDEGRLRGPGRPLAVGDALHGAREAVLLIAA